MERPNSREQRRKNTYNRALFLSAAKIAIGRGARDGVSVEGRGEAMTPRFSDTGAEAHLFRCSSELVPDASHPAEHVEVIYAQAYYDHEGELMPEMAQINLRYPFGTLKKIQLFRESEEEVSTNVETSLEVELDWSDIPRQQHQAAMDELMHTEMMILQEAGLGRDLSDEDYDDALHALGQL